MRDGKSPGPEAPDIQGDPSDPDAWETENLVFERICRQLRCVGDALAWRVMGYNRALVLALSRNERSGMLVNKEGLGWELGMIQEIWDERKRFALLHDITNCLRIGDFSEIIDQDNILVGEVKKGRNRNSVQRARLRAAIDAVSKEGELPGGEDARIVWLNTPHRAHLQALTDACQLAEERGVVGSVVPRGHRSLVCGAVSKIGARNTTPEGAAQL